LAWVDLEQQVLVPVARGR